MIKVSNLTKRYGDLYAIRGVSFNVNKGEILGFLGPNGAGKTTTMRIITGFLPATEGQVVVAGYDIFENSLEARKRIGYLPEHPPLYNEMTIVSYLRFVGKIKGVSKYDLEEAVERVVKQCGLSETADRVLGHLSKGYRQRVGLAQALINDPPVLVLDEPTIGLDPRQIIEIRSLIKNLAGDRTVILSTHILPEVSQICGKVAIINQGRIAVEGTLSQLTERMSLEEVFLQYVSGDHKAEPAGESKEGARA